MDYQELNDRLRALATSYSSARRQGTGLADVIARTAAEALPATSALRRLSDVLFGQGKLETKGVLQVQAKLADLQSDERKAAVLAATTVAAVQAITW